MYTIASQRLTPHDRTGDDRPREPREHQCTPKKQTRRRSRSRSKKQKSGADDEMEMIQTTFDRALYAIHSP
eukprot:scaffold5986_cov128-Isochrysis_galbana.AAC.1